MWFAFGDEEMFSGPDFLNLSLFAKKMNLGWQSDQGLACTHLEVQHLLHLSSF